MKKQELIHLHALLTQVEQEIENRGDVKVTHDEYEEHGVRHNSIHKSRDEHEIAVQLLIEDITESINSVQESPVASR